MNAQELTTKFIKEKITLKCGSLRFWGDWFGRPMDAFHKIIKIDYVESDDLLTLEFNEDEKLQVWNAKIIIANEKRFLIIFAKKIRWEWFYYGRPKAKENLYFEEFERKALFIKTSTNVDWYQPKFNTSIISPAVEIY